MTTDDLQAVRSDMCQQAAAWLSDAGHGLWVSGWVTRNRDVEAIALVAQIAGQLGLAAADSYDQRRWYAGATLTRQVVENHYLMALFRDDASQRVRWLDATPNRIEKSFRPGQMREAGGFKASEYKSHCTMGGHANPAARWLLPDHSGPVESEILSADLAQHLTETVDLLPAVLATVPDGPALLAYLPDQTAIRAVYDRWQGEDALASRVPRSLFQGDSSSQPPEDDGKVSQ